MSHRPRQSAYGEVHPGNEADCEVCQPARPPAARLVDWMRDLAQIQGPGTVRDALLAGARTIDEMTAERTAILNVAFPRRDVPDA